MDYETPLFFRLMKHADAVDRDVIDMVSGSPDWKAPEALRDGLRTYADAPPTDFQYPPTEGLPDLRAAIADRHGVDPDRVIVTNGAGEANYLAMATALEQHSGETIVLPDPVYPYYPGKTTLLGGTQRSVTLTPEGHLNPTTLASVVDNETAAIIVTTPNNPTGAVYEGSTLRSLAEIAADHDALLISDEVYDRYDYSNRFTSALEAAADETTVAVTNSFSKSMAITGFRVGYTILPERLCDAARSRHMLVNVAGSRPAQTAVLTALRETTDAYYDRCRQLMERRVETFVDTLEAGGVACYPPEGGFYVRVRLPAYDSTVGGAERLIANAGVAGMPGAAFGTDNDWFRFSLTTDRVETAAERLVDATV